jgi:hypothetical protein
MFSLSSSTQKQLETLHNNAYAGENINNFVLGCYEQQVFLAIYMGLKFSVKCYIFVDLHATNIHSVMIWMSLVFLIIKSENVLTLRGNFFYVAYFR